jgi:hypothetical protein
MLNMFNNIYESGISAIPPLIEQLTSGNIVTISRGPFTFFYLGHIDPVNIYPINTGTEQNHEPRVDTRRNQRIEEIERQLSLLKGRTIKFTNGRLPRLNTMSGQYDANVILDIGTTSFFDYTGTEAVDLTAVDSTEYSDLYDIKVDGNRINETAKPLVPNPLTAAVMIVTADGVLMSEANYSTAENKLVEGIGGYGKLTDENAWFGGSDPGYAIVREIAEETDAQPAEFTLSLRGRLLDHTYSRPSDAAFIFTAEAPNLTRGDLETRKTDKEISIRMLPLTQQAFLQAAELVVISQPYVISGLMCIALDRFGPAVVEKMNQIIE